MPKIFGNVMFGDNVRLDPKAVVWPVEHNFDWNPAPKGENVAYVRTREVSNWHFQTIDGHKCAPAIGVRMCGDGYNSTRITQVMPDGWLLTESGAAYRPLRGSNPSPSYREWIANNPDKLVDNDVLRFMQNLYPELFKCKPIADDGQVLMFKMKPAPQPIVKAGPGVNSMVSWYNEQDRKEVK